MGDFDDNGLKEEMEPRKHLLVNSEMGKERHRVYNFAMDCLDPKYLVEKPDVVFDSLKRAAKINVAFGFLLENVEDRNCRSCMFYYAHKNSTLSERS